jgi:hypothetical protein
LKAKNMLREGFEDEQDTVKRDSSYKKQYKATRIIPVLRNYLCDEYDTVFSIKVVSNFTIVICNYCNDYYSGKRRYNCLLIS